jgi:hypothetical protein
LLGKSKRTLKDLNQSLFQGFRQRTSKDELQTRDINIGGCIRFGDEASLESELDGLMQAAFQMTNCSQLAGQTHFTDEGQIRGDRAIFEAGSHSGGNSQVSSRFTDTQPTNDVDEDILIP